MDLFGITAFIVAHKFWIGFLSGLFVGANIAIFVIGLFVDGKNREQKRRDAMILKRRGYVNFN